MTSPKNVSIHDTDLMSELKSGNIYKALRVVLGTRGKHYISVLNKSSKINNVYFDQSKD